jgi:hypothetical protein
MSGSREGPSRPPVPAFDQRQAIHRFGRPNIFADLAKAFSQFQVPYVGNNGNRNMLRETGLFSTDIGLGKRFALPIGPLQFGPEAFNVKNTVTFDSSYWDLSTPGTFGRYSTTLVPPRVIQLGLRYDF